MTSRLRGPSGECQGDAVALRVSDPAPFVCCWFVIVGTLPALACLGQSLTLRIPTTLREACPNLQT